MLELLIGAVARALSVHECTVELRALSCSMMVQDT